MAIANIVLADAQATPVNHTFVPIGADSDGRLWFEDQSAANAVGYWRISVMLKRPSAAVPGTQSNASRVFKATISLHEPVLETLSNSTVSGITPAPTVAYVSKASAEYILPERGASLDRKNVRKMFASLMSEVQVVALIENLVTPF